jgi:predicted nucleic acid-binding Zn ribbon protein
VSQEEILMRGHVHACEVCGRRFTGVRADARYCSNACRQTAYRQRQGNDHD